MFASHWQTPSIQVQPSQTPLPPATKGSSGQQLWEFPATGKERAERGLLGWSKQKEDSGDERFSRKKKRKESVDNYSSQCFWPGRRGFTRTGHSPPLPWPKSKRNLPVIHMISLVALFWASLEVLSTDNRLHILFPLSMSLFYCVVLDHLYEPELMLHYTVQLKKHFSSLYFYRSRATQFSIIMGERNVFCPVTVKILGFRFRNRCLTHETSCWARLWGCFVSA